MGRNDFKHATGTDAQADKHTTMHMVAAATGAAIIALGTGAAVQPANATTEWADSCATGNQPCALETSKIIGQRDLAHVQTDQVVGAFSFTQNELSFVEDIAGTFRKTTSVLCNSTYKQVGDTANWQVEVGGDVLHEFSATLAELAPEHATSSIITCACSNNGAGGNAKATGITIASLAAQAGILPDVNAVRFTAADGTVSTLPLTYLSRTGPSSPTASTTRTSRRAWAAPTSCGLTPPLASTSRETSNRWSSWRSTRCRPNRASRRPTTST